MNFTSVLKVRVVYTARKQISDVFYGRRRDLNLCRVRDSVNGAPLRHLGQAVPAQYIGKYLRYRYQMDLIAESCCMQSLTL